MDIPFGYAAIDVSFNILNNLGVYRLDISGNIQVAVVFLNDVLNLHVGGIVGHVNASLPDVGDAPDVLLAQPVFGAVLHKAIFGVDDEDAVACGSLTVVKNDDAGRDARTEEDVWRQADDAFDAPCLCEQVFPDLGFRAATEQNPMREDAGATAMAGIHRLDDVEQEGIVAGAGRWYADAQAVTPSVIAVLLFGALQPALL